MRVAPASMYVFRVSAACGFLPNGIFQFCWFDRPKASFDNLETSRCSRPVLRLYKMFAQSILFVQNEKKRGTHITAAARPLSALPHLSCLWPTRLVDIHIASPFSLAICNDDDDIIKIK